MDQRQAKGEEQHWREVRDGTHSQAVDQGLDGSLLLRVNVFFAGLRLY